MVCICHICYHFESITTLTTFVFSFSGLLLSLSPSDVLFLFFYFLGLCALNCVFWLRGLGDSVSSGFWDYFIWSLRLEARLENVASIFQSSALLNYQEFFFLHVLFILIYILGAVTFLLPELSNLLVSLLLNFLYVMLFLFRELGSLHKYSP